MRRSGRARIWIASVVLAVVVAHSAGAQDDRISPLGGASISGRIESIDPQHVRLASGKVIELQAVHRIARPTTAPAKRPAVLVHLIDGATVRATDIAVESDVRINWAMGELVLPLSAVRGIRLALGEAGKADAPPLPPFEQALAKGGKQDALYVAVDGQAQIIEGALQRIDPKEITFLWQDTARKLPRAKPYGITLGAVAKPPDLVGQCLVEMSDGSTLWGRAKSLANNKLTLWAHGKDIVVPWDRVTTIAVRSDRLSYLSDLTPLDVVEEALVTFAGPWRKDRSVMNQPLTLGGTVFERGLGVHARCLLTYDCEGYSTFSAVIGLDDAARGKGDCVFRVIGDEKELLSRRVKGGEAPVPLRIDITGMKRLTLAVEPGENLDVGDHADWCDARLERPSPTSKPSP